MKGSKATLQSKGKQAKVGLAGCYSKRSISLGLQDNGEKARGALLAHERDVVIALQQ